MDTWAEQKIMELAIEIKKRIDGGMIYGVRVNMDNINHLIVASFLTGSMEGVTKITEEYKYLFERITNGTP